MNRESNDKNGAKQYRLVQAERLLEQAAPLRLGRVARQLGPLSGVFPVGDGYKSGATANSVADLVMPDTGFGTATMLDVRKVAGRLSISQRSVWRLVAQTELPPPVKIGKCSRWFLADIVAFEQKLRKQRAMKLARD